MVQFLLIPPCMIVVLDLLEGFVAMCKVSDAVCKLRQSELVSLEYIGSGPIRDRVPGHHAAKLLDLGLVEVSCGRLEHTPMGRRAMKRFNLRQMGSFRDGPVH